MMNGKVCSRNQKQILRSLIVGSNGVIQLHYLYLFNAPKYLYLYLYSNLNQKWAWAKAVFSFS